eukprot:31515-Rhodomonas_salina.3
MITLTRNASQTRRRIGFRSDSFECKFDPSLQAVTVSGDKSLRLHAATRSWKSDVRFIVCIGS